jgi:hypothetical protein
MMVNLSRRLTEREVLRAELAWVSGHRGQSGPLGEAAQVREKAEAAYEAAFERAMTQRSAAACEAEREEAKRRAAARDAWRALLLTEVTA